MTSVETSGWWSELFARLPSVPSSEALGSFVVTAGGTNISLTSSVPSSEAFGSHTLRWNQPITLPSIPSSEGFGAHQLNYKLTLPSIGSSEAFGSHTLLPAPAVITLPSVGSSEAFGSHTVSALSVAYRAAATGITTATFSSPVTWTHTGVSGDTAVVFASCDRWSDLSVTYDGVPMKFKGGMLIPGGYNSGGGTTVCVLRVFTIPITAGNAGAKTVSLVNPAGGYVAGDSVSYTGVVDMGVPYFIRGLGTALSHGPLTPPGSGMLAQAFAAGWVYAGTTVTLSSLTGGTSRYNLTNNYADLSIRDANASATFAGTASLSTHWGSLVLPLRSLLVPGPKLDISMGIGFTLWTTGNISYAGPVVTAGADVFVEITIDRGGTTITGATYDGNAMTLVDSQTHTSWSSGSAITYRFRRTGVAAGSKTILLTTAGGTAMYYSVSVTAITGVTSLGATTKTSGAATTTPSQSVTLTSGQLALHSLGISAPSVSGWYPTGDGAILADSLGMLNYGNTLTRISDKVGSNTFGISDTTNAWGSMITVLS